MAQKGGVAHSESWPGCDMIKEEIDVIRKAEVGNPRTPFARTPHVSGKVHDMLNKAIQYHHNVCVTLATASTFFSRDNVGLPGIAMYFKIASQEQWNTIWKVVDFMVKRGGVPEFGPTHGPDPDWPAQGEKGSDVTFAFIKALAMAKVAYEKLNCLYEVANGDRDAHAVDFITNALRSTSECNRQLAHYVAHLKAIEGNKLAVKEFDRRLPFEIEDLACAAGIEAGLPARMQEGTNLRAERYRTMAIEQSRGNSADQLMARRAFNMVM